MRSLHQNKPLALGDEIFHLIMSGLDQKSLSVVCRTTKLFHKYAVGILWRSIDGMLPLMRLFPEEAVTYEMEKGRYVFSKVLRETDWKRFEYYALFVRAFTFDEEKTSWTSFPTRWAESLLLRSFLAPRQLLLPALTALEWKALTSDGLLTGLPHFVAQNLDSLSVTFLTNDATTALPSLAGFLESNPPPLSNLEIILCLEANSNSRTFFDLAHDIGRIIQNFPDVSSLRSDRWILIYGIRPSLRLQNLGRMFAEANVDWDAEGRGWKLIDGQTELFLPNLQHVRCHELAWVPFCSLFLNTVDTILSFTLSQPDDVIGIWTHDHSELVDAFKIMGNHFVNLTSLRLQGLSTVQDEGLTGSLLPFLQCKNMEEFDIFAEAEFMRFISDDDIAQMAGAWSRLKKFIIRCSDFEKSTRYDTDVSDLIPFSFFSIATLAQHCPLLRTLSLSIKVGADVVLHNQLRYEGPFRLDELDLGYSLIPNESDFASLLSDICPSHRIKWNNVEKSSVLKEVLSALQLLAQTRRAEELARQTTELRQRVELLIEERKESHRTFQTQIDELREENEALRSRAENLGDVKL